MLDDEGSLEPGEEQRHPVQTLGSELDPDPCRAVDGVGRDLVDGGDAC